VTAGWCVAILGVFLAGWIAGAVTLGFALTEPPRSTHATPATERKLRLVVDGCSWDRIESRRGDRYLEARVLSRTEERR